METYWKYGAGAMAIILILRVLIYCCRFYQCNSYKSGQTVVDSNYGNSPSSASGMVFIVGNEVRNTDDTTRRELSSEPPPYSEVFRNNEYSRPPPPKYENDPPPSYQNITEDTNR